jgi:hypothetical protein
MAKSGFPQFPDGSDLQCFNFKAVNGVIDAETSSCQLLNCIVKMILTPLTQRLFYLKLDYLAGGHSARRKLNP